jgi:hypothetical protein
MLQLIFRFLVGGLVVSSFAALGDVLKPKSFAGLFGAAPSVAIVTLGLTVIADGKTYAATEARSMLAGAVAFLLYAVVSSRLMIKHRWHAASTAISTLVLWFAVALSGWLLFLR